MKIVIHDTNTACENAPNGNSWIDYWREKVNLDIPSICPCCGQEIEEVVGAHVINLIALAGKETPQFITPTCKVCNDKYKYSQATKHPFRVEDSMLLKI